jgi:hypothetical protein
VRKCKARRKAIGISAPILILARGNGRWSLDFVHIQFACWRRFRVLKVVDDVTRESLAAIPDALMSGCNETLFPQPRPCPGSDRGQGDRLQHRKAPFGPRLPNTRRLRPAPDYRNRPTRCT